jgi:large subunit ribosomal protein L33
MARQDHKIEMKSTESPHAYTRTKNKRNTTEKLELMMYDPILRRHVLYKEKKISK